MGYFLGNAIRDSCGKHIATEQEVVVKTSMGEKKKKRRGQKMCFFTYLPDEQLVSNLVKAAKLN